MNERKLSRIDMLSALLEHHLPSDDEIAERASVETAVLTLRAGRAADSANPYPPPTAPRPPKGAAGADATCAQGRRDRRPRQRPARE